jgi:hypothetical protein
VKIDLFTPEELPSWFEYPEDFVHEVESGLYDVGHWQILIGDRLRLRHGGLAQRFPDQELVPFARRFDGDDVACWSKKSMPMVQVVRDFSAPGWEERQSYASFQSWHAQALQEESDDED